MASAFRKLLASLPKSDQVQDSSNDQPDFAESDDVVPLQSIVVFLPSKPLIVDGEPRQFRALGEFFDNTNLDITNEVDWESSNNDVILFFDPSTPGRASCLSPGTATIRATSRRGEGSVEVEVRAPNVTDKELVQITISPKEASILRHEKQTFMATGTFSDGSEQGNIAVEWECSKPKFIAIGKKTGVAVANHATTAAITARDPVTGLVSDPATITVVELESIKIIPEKPPSLPARLQILFRAEGTFTDGKTEPSFAVEWESSKEHIVSIDDQTGRATGNSPGTATIKANAGKANRAIHAEVAITVTEGTPLPGQVVDLSGLRKDLQSAGPSLQKTFDAERSMDAAAARDNVDLEDPKSAVANRPPSGLSDQDKTNLHASFAQVEQARVQMAHILHEMQATSKELATAIKLQLSLKRPPDEPDLTQEQKDQLSQTRRLIAATILDGLSQIVSVFLDDKFMLEKLGLAIIGTDAVKDQVKGADEELERHLKKIDELGDKLERTLERTITALQDAATDQIRDLKEKWRVEQGDWAEQAKIYKNALHDYQKLVLSVTAKGGGGPGFEQTFASILLAAQTSQCARSRLNTARLRPDAAKVFLAELQNPGTLVGKELKNPDVVFYEKGGKIFSFVGETSASLQDLAKQVQKVNDFYKSSARIDRIFKKWKDALEDREE